MFVLFFPTVCVEVVRCWSVPPALLHFLCANGVQLTAPIGDNGQLMSGGSGGWPVLWLSTTAVQLTAPIGDDGQLMS